MKEKEFFVRSIVNWAKDGNLEKFPWRDTSNIWHIALAELLLSRTPAHRVLPVYQTLTEKYPTPDSTNLVDLAELTSVLKPLGLQNKKAIQIKALAKVFQRKRNEESLREELKKVPGIGRYTYNALLLFAFRTVRPIVDANVGRIFSRYFGLKWKGKAVTDEAAWELAWELVPKEANEATTYSYGLLDFGSKVCKRNPDCKFCPLKSFCNFYSSFLTTPTARRKVSDKGSLIR